MAKKILISDHRDIAEKHIETLKAQARGISELIKVYNDLPVVNPIESRDQTKEFLNDPADFLDKAILKDSGITFSTKANPLPEQIAKLFGIDRDSFLQQLSRVRIGNLEYMDFDPDSLELTFDSSKEPEIFEEFKEYARSAAEAREILKIRELCKHLNEHCERYGILPSEMHLISDRIGLKCVLKDGGHDGYELRENVSFIRSRLEYEEMHGTNQ